MLAAYSTSSTTPGVLWVGWQSVRTEAYDLLMTELFGCNLSMAVIAEVASVVVLVAASEGQRRDVVDDGSELHAVTFMAQLA